MATYYIDPSAASDGTGTFASPYNDWSPVTGNIAAYTTAGNTYLGKEGTTWTSGTGNLNLAAANLTFGTYDATTGDQISDGNRRTTLDFSACTATRCIRGDATTDNLVIDSLHIIGSNTTDIINTTSGQSGLTVRNCKLIGTGANATSKNEGIYHLGGGPVYILNNDISKTNSGIWVQPDTGDTVSTEVSLINNNRIHDLAGTTAGDGDGIFIGTIGSFNIDHDYKFFISGNYITGYQENAIDILQNEIICENNDIGAGDGTNGVSGINVGVSGDYGSNNIIRNNYIHDITLPANTAKAPLRNRGGINNKYYNNIISNVSNGTATVGLFNYTSGESGSWSMYNNSIIDCQCEYLIRMTTTGTITGEFYNNIITGCTVDTNRFYLNDTDAVLAYGNNCFQTGLPGDSSALGTLTDAGDNITGDPKLNSDHTLQASSPCIGAGTAPLSEMDHDGKYRKTLSNDIGAKWFDAHEDSTVERLLASGGTS